MYIGTDYYPEHWPRERWNTDAKLMQKAGFNIVRLAEFAWVDMEPEEGRFEFGWLDDVLDILKKHGIDVILCTPTATMPAWVMRKYPEVMAQQEDGTRIEWGTRKNNCFTSGAYRLLSGRITRAMAEHFKNKPNVIGWQTDNEFSGPKCFCESCRAGFQAWLKRKYSSLDSLNCAWGTHFWGQRVQQWDEIVFPSKENRHNPGLALDYQRFHSWLNVRFQSDQVKILRKVCPKHFVTHNFMGLHMNLNYYDLAEDLDLVSLDNYCHTSPAPRQRYRASLAADLMRGLKRRNFWIMEQTAGPTGSTLFSRNPRPGEIRNISYQQLAHGADGQIWFRWRTCTAGREQYWHGLLGHDGRPLRRYNEASQTAQEYHKLAKELAETTVKSPVAMIYDYDTIWALNIQPCYHENLFSEVAHLYYDALLRAGVNVDVVKPGTALSGYKAVIAPELYVLPDRIADQLVTYVKQGGILLTDCRTAVKDENNLCHERTLPGKLGPVLGIEIQEYESLRDGLEYSIRGTPKFPGEFTAIHFTDWVIARQAKALAGFKDWHMQRYAAVTRHVCGQGCGWYAGTIVKEPAFYDQLIDGVLTDARVRPVVKPVDGVEVSVRQGKGRKLLFVINHLDEPREVKVPAGKRELLSGKKTGSVLKLDRFGVAVIKLK